MKLRILLALFFSLSGLGTTAFADQAPSKVRGWLEHVWIPAVSMELDAKLDTGAKTSSIHAEIIESPAREDFEEDAGQVITFRLLNEDGDVRQMTAPIARWAAIKAKKGGVIYRPVVDFDFCIAGVLVSGEVTLANRGHFNYETLIGRNMLKKARIIVDANEIYTDQSRCE